MQTPDPARAAEALREIHRRIRANALPHLRGLTPKQFALVTDPATRKAALWGRRSGKSYVDGAYLLHVALTRPSSPCAFVAIDKPSARRILWDHPVHGLPALITRYKLPARPYYSDLTVRFKNGNVVYSFGADDPRDIDKLRGLGWGLVVIDEAGSYRNSILHSLVRDVLEPATMDTRGTILVTGTPGIVPQGFWFDITDGADPDLRWSTHRATVLDNEHMRDPAAYLAEILRKNKWTVHHPTYQREYLGRWVTDRTMQLYAYDDARNGLDALPKLDAAGRKIIWTHGLAIDLGGSEIVRSTAFSCWAWSRQIPGAFETANFKRSAMSVQAMADETRQLAEARGGFARMVGDHGGLGNRIFAEIAERFGLVFEPAQKEGKLGYIELMNGAFAEPSIFVVRSECRDHIEEMGALFRADDGTEPKGKVNHSCDAGVYGWRDALGYLGREQRAGPAPGSDAFYVAEAKARLDAAFRKHDQERRKREQRERILHTTARRR